MFSLIHYIFLLLLPYLGFKRRLETAEAVRRVAAKKRASGAWRMPWLIGRRVTVSESVTSAGWPLVTMTPKAGGGAGSTTAGGSSAQAATIIYLHGGGYYGQVHPLHYWWLTGLIRRTGCTAVVPIYPLVSHTTCAAVVPPLLDVFKAAAAAHPRGAAGVIIAGDSAGGGMAMALAIAARDAGLPPAAALVLISPWVDVTFNSPPVDAALRAADPWLAVDGLREAGRLYAGTELDVTHPWVSPVHDSMARLPPLHIFIGTRDILLPACRLLRDKARAAGVPVVYEEAPGMIHVYPILPIAEAEAPTDKVAVLVRAVSAGATGRA
jgi:acetyl esterase/lipase